MGSRRRKKASVTKTIQVSKVSSSRWKKKKGEGGWKMLSSPLLPILTILLQLLQQLRWRALPIPLRIILRPPPQILTRVLQRPLRLPPQLLVRLFRVRRQVQHVPGPPSDDFIGQVSAYGGAEGFDHVKDGAAFACAEVPGSDAGMVIAEVVEGDEVALGEVEDVDVVADGGAVG